MRRWLSILSLWVAFLGASCSRPPEAVEFDFTTGFTLANAHWPATETGGLYERYGSYHFIIKLSDGLSLDVPNGNAYSVLRDGKALGHIIVYFGVHSTLDQAYSQAKRMLEDLHDPKSELEGLDRWHAAMIADPKSNGRSEFGYRGCIAIIQGGYSKDGHVVSSLFVQISQ